MSHKSSEVRSPSVLHRRTKSRTGNRKSSEIENHDEILLQSGQTLTKFCITINAVPRYFTESIGTAYDSRFTLQFPGLTEPEITYPIGIWDRTSNNIHSWTKEITQIVDKNYCLTLEQKPLIVSIEEKSIEILPPPVEEEETNSKSRNKRESKTRQNQTATSQNIQTPNTASTSITNSTSDYHVSTHHKDTKRKKRKDKNKNDTDEEERVSTAIPELEEIEFQTVQTAQIDLSPLLFEPNPIIYTVQETTDSTLNPPKSLHLFTISIHAVEHVMSPELVEELKPVMLTIDNVENTPIGFGSSNTVATGPQSYEEMNKMFQSVYCSYDFLPPEIPLLSSYAVKEPETALTDQTPSRSSHHHSTPHGHTPHHSNHHNNQQHHSEPQSSLTPLTTTTVTTQRLQHQSTLSFQHRRCFLLGKYDLSLFGYWCQTHQLSVQFHDRNVRGAINKQQQAVEDQLKAEAEEQARLAAEAKMRKKNKRKIPKTASKKQEEKEEKVEEKVEETADKFGSTLSLPTTANLHSATQQLQNPEVADTTSNIYGVASFSLLDLFSGSRTIELSSEISAVYPSLDKPLYAQQQRCNPYSTANTTMNLTLRLHNTLTVALPHQFQHKFTRCIVVMKYTDLERYQRIMNCIVQCNATVMQMQNVPEATMALLAVKLTEEQQSDQSELDILTGVQVIDGKFRILIIEGLAIQNPNATAMKELYNILQSIHTTANKSIVQVLYNEQISWPSRLYTSYHVTVKNIKLVKTIKELVKQSKLYLQSYEQQQCYETLRILSALPTIQRLRVAYTSNLFPTVTQLTILEKQYGSYVSDTDLLGYAQGVIPHNGLITPKAPQMMQVEQPPTTPAQTLTQTFEKQRYKPGLDMNNSNYLLQRKSSSTNEPVDYLQRYKSAITVRSEHNRTASLASQPTLLHYPEEQPVYMYSSQKLNYRSQQQRELRKQMAETKDDKVYSYSDEYVSGSFVPVDIDEHNRKEREESKEKMLKQHNGQEFRWPAHKTKSESLAMPHNVLPQNYEPSSTVPVDVASTLGRTLASISLEKDFRAYGKFNREFGFPGNPDWNKSVHLTGIGLAAEKQAAVEAEKQKWKSMVKVDNTYFKVHYKNDAQNPRHIDQFSANEGKKVRSNQIDKYHSLLADPPVKDSLKFQKSVRDSEGNVVDSYSLPLLPAPVSAFTGPYSPPSQYIPAHTLQPGQYDFNSYASTVKKTHIHRRKITTGTDSEHWKAQKQQQQQQQTA